MFLVDAKSDDDVFTDDEDDDEEDEVNTFSTKANPELCIP